ncbi:restriction endonuclease subunit S [Clostridium perfringens]|nr:restriction endonuclease subunit S [Clostridium perfringens]
MNKKDVLKNLIEIDSGYAFKSSFFNDNFEGIPIIRIRDINSGIAETYYSGDYEEKFIVNNDDLLIGMDGNFKIRKWSGGKALLNQRVCRIKSISNKLSNEYLYRILPLELKLIEDKTSFVTVKHLSVKDINNIELIIPDIDIQNKIVKIIDKSQELIDNRKKQIEELDLLVKSKFIEMFGNPVNNDMKWDKVVCNDITSKIGSGATPKGGNSSYKEQGISLIRSMNVHNNTFLVKDLAFIDDKQAEKLKNVIVKEDDILLNITGASVARCCKVPKDIIPARVNQHVAILRCDNEKINPSFMEYQFTNESYQRLLWDIATSGGATREAITKQQIQMLEVILPPIELQNQFADFVKQVDKLKFEMEKSLKELEDNFNSLMQKAFKGELFK